MKTQLNQKGVFFGTYQRYERDQLSVDVFNFMPQTWFNEKICQPGVNGYQEIMKMSDYMHWLKS